MKIIAEVGINHNGDMNMAKQLIDVACVAGCDAVKFQKRTIDAVYTAEFLESPRKSPWGETQRAQKEGLEFDLEQYKEIDAYCRSKKIDWFASAWDVEAQKFLQQFNLKNNKIASAMLTNIPLLEETAAEGRHTYIATGMSTFEEIDRAVEIFKNCPFTLMHTNSTYPMPEEDANLRIMGVLRARYDCQVGYSGHEQGILVCTAAIAMGAAAIERHITLDKTMYGSDQSASLEPQELTELVATIRKVQKIMGTGEKVLTSAESAIRDKLRPKA